MSVQRCKTDFEILTPTVFPAESIKNKAVVLVVDGNIVLGRWNGLKVGCKKTYMH
jgi:hypothetical protein